MESVDESVAPSRFKAGNKSRVAQSEVGKPTQPRFIANQRRDEDEEMKVEFGDNKAIEKSMRSGMSGQVDPRFLSKGLGAQSQAPKSQAAYSQAAKKTDQTKQSHKSRKTAAMMNKKETIVDEGSYYDDQEEYEEEYDEESEMKDPFAKSAPKNKKGDKSKASKMSKQTVQTKNGWMNPGSEDPKRKQQEVLP